MGAFLRLNSETRISRSESLSRSNAEHTERVRQSLARRNVAIAGDWHFWVMYADWRISAEGRSIGGRLFSDGSDDDPIRALDGQRLKSVAAGSSTNSYQFEFDLGGRLEVWPSPDFPADDLWSLHRWEGEIVALRPDGSLTVERKIVPIG